MTQPKHQSPTLRLPLSLAALLTLLVSSCALVVPPAEPVPPPPKDIPVAIQFVDLDTQPCTDSFQVHDLAHVTSASGDAVKGFASNGSGAAVGDLDQDGDLDLALGGFAQPSTILVNEGGLRFTRLSLGEGWVRELQLVDVDGDGRLDIVTTRRGTGIAAWRNITPVGGQPEFESMLLAGVDRPLYSMDWADVDGDGDLDLGGATYDAEMLDIFGSEFMMGDAAGVYLYARQADGYSLIRLEDEAQGLASLFLDVNGDRMPELIVGNDFAVPDMVFAWQDGQWRPLDPFAVTTHSTMSLAAGDINNDGRPDLFATDMKPPSDDPAVLSQWAPVMDSMMSATMDAHDHRQLMENVLQLAPGGDLGWRNVGAELELTATGWSWSGKFGDLDNDGWLDIYVVNGMMEEKIFGHLPNHELVEANMAFRNLGEGRFARADGWNLDSERSGRGMVMADLDLDGDLDIVVNNMRGAAQLFENRLCGQASVQFDLRWPASANSHAVGAEVTLATAAGEIVRRVHVASGYLSGETARLHMGVGAEDGRLDAHILWPDGQESWVAGPAPNQLVIVTRTE